MYLPYSFRSKDREELIEFISEWSFGDLITTTSSKVNISYVPFVFDQDNMLLYGHLSKQDFQHLHLEQIEDLVVIFKEPINIHNPRIQRTADQPSWSFQSIHVKGRPELINKIQLLTVVDGLTRKHEKQFGNPWGDQPLSPEELDNMIREIVGVRIHIEEIIGKYKRSHAHFVNGHIETRLDSESTPLTYSVVFPEQ